jgi:ankyrin repeat protein
VELAKLLLGMEGIDFNATDSKGQTPLIHASREGYHQVVRLLLECEGLNLDLEDGDGKSAIEYAVIQQPVKRRVEVWEMDEVQRQFETIRCLLQQESPPHDMGTI